MNPSCLSWLFGCDLDEVEVKVEGEGEDEVSFVRSLCECLNV